MKPDVYSSLTRFEVGYVGPGNPRRDSSFEQVSVKQCAILTRCSAATIIAV
jgi:hypothetical protein